MLSLWVPSETLLRLAHGVVGAVANPPCTSLWVLSETLPARLATFGFFLGLASAVPQRLGWLWWVRRGFFVVLEVARPW